MNRPISVGDLVVFKRVCCPSFTDANVDQHRGLVYIRDDEWPKLRDELRNLPARH